MIASLRGTIRKLGPDHLVVEVGGVGFRVFVPVTTLSLAGTVGDVTSLVTHLQVREDVLALYGFSTEEELALFELFLTVSGVGPRVALSLLSSAPAESLRAAIADGNVDYFTRVPGIGKKTASRIILELRGKIEFGPTAGALQPVTAQVVDALVSLGYSAAEAREAVAHAPSDRELSFEDRIREALRYFAPR